MRHSNHNATRACLAAAALGLTGCPQLLPDDFVIVDDISAGRAGASDTLARGGDRGGDQSTSGGQGSAATTATTMVTSATSGGAGATGGDSGTAIDASGAGGDYRRRGELSRFGS